MNILHTTQCTSQQEAIDCAARLIRHPQVVLAYAYETVTSESVWFCAAIWDAKAEAAPSEHNVAALFLRSDLVEARIF